MKTAAKILENIDFLLKESTRGYELPSNMDENMRHALDDLIFSGMVKYTQLNPTLKIKRIA